MITIKNVRKNRNVKIIALSFFMIIESLEYLNAGPILSKLNIYKKQYENDQTLPRNYEKLPENIKGDILEFCYGKNPLKKAISRKNIPLMSILIALKTQPYIDEQLKTSVVHDAVDALSIHALKRLISHNFYLNSKDIQNLTPLDYALLYASSHNKRPFYRVQFYEVCRLLQQAQAESSFALESQQPSRQEMKRQYKKCLLAFIRSK